MWKQKGTSRRSRIKCVVAGCPSISQLFKFPQDDESVHEWLDSLNRLDLITKSNKRDLRVCSDHFTEEDFITPKVLKPFVVPQASGEAPPPPIVMIAPIIHVDPLEEVCSFDVAATNIEYLLSGLPSWIFSRHARFLEVYREIPRPNLPSLIVFYLKLTKKMELEIYVKEQQVKLADLEKELDIRLKPFRLAEFVRLVEFGQHIEVTEEEQSCGFFGDSSETEPKPTSSKLPCEKCGLMIPKSDMRRHIEIKHSEKRFKCDICSSSFTTRNYITIHMNLVHLKRRIFRCRYCSEEFRTGGLHKRHLDEQHDSEKTFQCSTCGRRFFTDPQLKTHVKICVAGSDPLFACLICPRKFRLKTILEQHLMCHTNPDYSHVCTECPARFFTKALLTQHVKKRHTKSFRHRCQFCPATFHRPLDRMEHENRHLDLRPFICGHCETAFFSRKSLVIHIRKQHKEAGVKRYRCTICTSKEDKEADFKRLEFLIKHIRRRHPDDFDPATDYNEMLIDRISNAK